MRRVMTRVEAADATRRRRCFVAPSTRATLIALLALLLVACAASRARAPRTPSLQGAWTSGGPSFDMVIKERTILFEFDMKEHPYRVDGKAIVIDFQDPALGIQRKRIVRLTADELEIEDEPSGARQVLRRMPQ